MTEQIPDVEPGLPGDDEDGTWMPDDDPAAGEDQTPIPDDRLDFPDSGDDSHADDDVEDPDILDDDSNAVG